MNRKTAATLFKTTASQAMDDNLPRLAAALAYYTAFSLAPLLIIVIGIVALVLGHQGAVKGLSGQIEGLVGQPGADAIQSILQSADKPAQGAFSTAVGFVTLFLGASGVFGELQSALNLIWKTSPKASSGVWGFLRTRFFSFLMVLGTGFLLLVSLLASTVISAIGTALGGMLPFGGAVAHGVSFLASLLLTAALFAVILKAIPNVPIQWRHVWIGAIVTALLFTAGKSLLGVYLGHSAVTSSYGAAGSIIIVLLWVYYSSLLVLAGAEFTHAYYQWRTGSGERGPG